MNWNAARDDQVEIIACPMCRFNKDKRNPCETCGHSPESRLRVLDDVDRCIVFPCAMTYMIRIKYYTEHIREWVPKYVDDYIVDQIVSFLKASYSIGDKIEICDNDNVWMVGTAVEQNMETITVRVRSVDFIRGASVESVQFHDIDKDSSVIAPLLSHTDGYEARSSRITDIRVLWDGSMLRKLIALGFYEQEAIDALLQCRNNFDQAVEDLLSL